MKYVLDASVGIKWVMNEIDSLEARHLRSPQPTYPFIIALASFP